MYDSLLYGNGLSIGTLYGLMDIGSNSKFDRYLDFNTFMKEFIDAESHKKLKKDFENLFDLHSEEYKKNREMVIRNIREEYEQISIYGFERWVSKALFVDKSLAGPEEKLFSYLIYNYWYSLIVNEILYRKTAVQFIEEYSKKLLIQINNKDNIYTTNFDMIHDNVLNPKHIHGKFSYPFIHAKDVIYKFLSPDEFEYKFLLGTNGFEKLNRINRVKQYNDKPFNDDFFFLDNIELGHLLICGLAFGRAEFMSDDFLSDYPEHRSNNLLMSVDGHIILRLQALYVMNKLDKVTITYYSESDLKNYMLIFNGSPLNKIIELKKYAEIVQ